MGRLSPTFEGDTVVVTGASSGIGRAVALAFADAGATVLNADVREEPKELRSDGSSLRFPHDEATFTTHAETPTHELAEERGATAEFLECDVSDPAEIEAVVEHARDYGGVDVMVNNAGIHISKRFREVRPDDLRRVHEVNTYGAFFGTQLAAEDMISRGESGTIVNTASTTMGVAEWEHSHYATTKGAIRMLTRSAALELAGHDVRVNAVAPGPVATEITEGWSERAGAVDAGDTDQPTLPLRAATPDELPGAYLFLASEDASFVTGETVWVDGGDHVC
ncbi:short-chain dehydrogenase [Haloprofundus marisrubri]|uniref:Short-chain dehydrogenase n=1 Tax=Haloprofundus marisrubri TaxID=1514971 RepID=A0A0W1R8S5_9EURY|nr:SDR family oxidoreductase [Haloprofundus marisrubri]KTG10036.1 short-chain dehydrogenase [Haloprofundus marisrubri]